MSAVITPTFLGLMLLSVVTIALLVVLDRRLEGNPLVRRVNGWFEQRREHAPLVMRIGVGAVLLMSWQNDVIVAPELHLPWSWLGWFEFGCAFLLLFRATTPIAGVGVLTLAVIAIGEFGIFHILDYALLIGVGWYLIVRSQRNEKLAATGLPALYGTLGFSLCWVALEKMVYPQWTLFLLDQHPTLALGLPHEFFLIGAAFVEICLGYLIIICLMERTLALTILTVFFLTTLTFGKVEVVGHTIVHAILIVFLLEGPGRVYKAPITFHHRLALRAPFAAVNFVIVVFVLLFAYTNVAAVVHERHVATGHRHEDFEVGQLAKVPTVELRARRDAGGGVTLELVTSNFRFTPQATGGERVAGEGHAHLYIDGRKAGRIYGHWHYLPRLPSGRHELRVTLNANDHGRLIVHGKPIEASVEVDSDAN